MQLQLRVPVGGRTMDGWIGLVRPDWIIAFFSYLRMSSEDAPIASLLTSCPAAQQEGEKKKKKKM